MTDLDISAMEANLAAFATSDGQPPIEVPKPTPPKKKRKHWSAPLREEFSRWVTELLSDGRPRTSAEVYAEWPGPHVQTTIQRRLIQLVDQGVVANVSKNRYFLWTVPPGSSKDRHFTPASEVVEAFATAEPVPPKDEPEEPLFSITVYGNRAEMSLADAAQLLAGVAASFDRSAR